MILRDVVSFCGFSISLALVWDELVCTSVCPGRVGGVKLASVSTRGGLVVVSIWSGCVGLEQFNSVRFLVWMS